MFLYHYTNVFPETIKRDGLCCSYKSEDTEIINEVLNELEEHPNWIDRSYCLFFHIEKITGVGEYIVTIDTNQLDANELYVANGDIAQKVFDAIYYGKQHLYKNLAQEYWESVMPLETYLKNDMLYLNSEILYLRDIKPQQIHQIEQV